MVFHFLTGLIALVYPKVALKFLYEKVIVAFFIASNSLQECNPFRWVDYSLSSSLIVILCGACSGIYDVHIQILIGTMCGITMFLLWCASHACSYFTF